MLEWLIFGDIHTYVYISIVVCWFFSHESVLAKFLLI
jgi:hypothetical protein